VSLVAIAAAPGCVAAETAASPRLEDEAAIRAASKAYIAALAKGDDAALAALWTPDGDIVDAAGNQIPGRMSVAIDAEPESPDPADRPAFEIHETRLRFLTDNVAIEDGTVEVSPPSGPPLTGRFSATWVKHEGTWKLAALREARGDAPSPQALLADLDWMVGDWVVIDAPRRHDDPAKPQIEVSARWNAGKTYLVRTMTITHSADAPPLEITQQIGWDPLSKSIHSWVFGSDGSQGEANWERDGQSWVAQARAIHPDGTRSTSLNIYTYDGKDRCLWRSLPTHVGSEHMPTVNMTMVRKPTTGSTTPVKPGEKP
jgi:uncharacterized protein (TIGR02246 family)